MSDPERLLQMHAADPEVRGLLDSLGGVKPGSGAGLRSWGAMAVKLAALPPIVALPGNAAVAPGGAAANADASAAAGTAGVSASSGTVSASAGPLGVRAFAVKLVVAAIVPAALVGSAYGYHATHRAGAEAPTASATVVAPIAAPSAAPPTDDSPSQTAAEGTRAPAPNASRAASSSRTGRLEAEASVLAKARRELRNGNPRAAQATLSQLQSSLPKGVLGQEREALAIEVLAANGDTASAKRRAAAFIAAHPTSPYSAKVKRVAEAP